MFIGHVIIHFAIKILSVSSISGIGMIQSWFFNIVGGQFLFSTLFREFDFTLVVNLVLGLV